MTPKISGATFFILIPMLAIAVLGGTAQFGLTYDILPRVTAIILIACVAYHHSIWALLKKDRLLLALIAGTIGLLLVQLIPLPPGLWNALPGRAAYQAIYPAMEIDQPWLPLSLAPERTLDALLFMVVPIAAFFAGRVSKRQQQLDFILSILFVALLSIAIGGVQMTQSEGGPAYLYLQTSYGSPVGFFSNRNHQGIFLACCLPLLWAAITFLEARGFRRPAWFFGFPLMALVIIAMFATQSRAAAGIGMAGLLAALFLIRTEEGLSKRQWIVGGSVALVALLLFVANDAILARFAANPGEFNRADVYIILKQLISAHWLTGSGFGTFELTAPRFEPVEILNGQYWNHAHNDFAQIWAEGGIFGVALGIAALVWIFGASRVALSTKPAERKFALACIIIITMLLAHSTVDYPLRTASLSALFAYCCGWLVAMSEWKSERRERT